MNDKIDYWKVNIDSALPFCVDQCDLGDLVLDVPHKLETQDLTPARLTPDNQQIVKIIELVHESGRLNKDLCKIRVGTNWNIPLLSDMLHDYHDKEVLQYLEYGFPVDRDDEVQLELGGLNHRGATDHPQHIDEYIKKEIELGAMIGPFDNIPFKSAPVAISPLSTRPKKGTTAHRIIMDCSWPLGSSLNDGISKTQYQGENIELKYPTIDTVCRKIFDMKNHGKGGSPFTCTKKTWTRHFVSSRPTSNMFRC